MDRIESTSNEKIKLAVKLATSSKHRRETGLFFLEGLRLCRDAAITGYEIVCTFVSENALQRLGEELNVILSSSKISFVIRHSVEQ